MSHERGMERGSRDDGGPEGVFKKVSLVESLTLYAIDF